MADEIAWAREAAESLLAPLGQRSAHTLGVVDRARSFRGALRKAELDVLVAAAYLHDVGYAPTLVRSGFHPLDGARFLRANGGERLARLAHHSGARAEAEERGLADQLDDFPEGRSLVADALTFCDLVTAPDGSPTTSQARLVDVLARYGDDDPVARAVRRSGAELPERIRRFDAKGGWTVLALNDALARAFELHQPA